MHKFRLSFTFTLPRIESFCEEKMTLRELLCKFFVDCNLNEKLVAAEYLSRW